MVAIEFTLRVSSMYSIRVPYSYQCARTYPLPPPSTIKGLCANALWMRFGGNPVDHLKNLHQAIIGATSRSEYPIAISACTVRVVPMNALIRQFAFAPAISCLILFNDERNSLASNLADALLSSPIYLGDSESLVTCLKLSKETEIVKINKGAIVKVNTVSPFNLIIPGSLNSVPESKSTVFYMQSDPISPEAELQRYLAPLSHEADTYYPQESYSFEIADECFLVRGEKLAAVFSPEKPNFVQEESKKGRKAKTK
ncbi:MAG: CRISPR-associated protein Cas5 [candidate division KSB1 bacterium]|nr:CRISPR-associated protein Cas5 [candidate division KSB1 bacterium]MDZ7399619.1 CRISPR-associated protein Cas5 [candidate division KSB1 bacterium]